MNQSGRWTRFQHVISIGFFCSVASELKRYGLRDGSYPFDWVICGLPSAIELLETDFRDFTDPASLQRHPVYPEIVQQARLEIDFNHDFRPDVSIEEQVDSVREKYSRRIERFQTASRQPTLFVRYLGSIGEHAYLEEHMDRLMRVLHERHPKNDLLIVGNDELPAMCGPRPVYRVAIDEGDLVAREFVRKNRHLHRRLLLLNYPLIKRLRNYTLYLHSTRDRRRDSVKRALRPLMSFAVGEQRLQRLLRRVRVPDTESTCTAETASPRD